MVVSHRLHQFYIQMEAMKKNKLEKKRLFGAKKEYPMDVSMPYINNGIYGMDEFRMYTFKVKPCSRAYTHDWTECPFVHPGENACRRDLRKFNYNYVLCPEFLKGVAQKEIHASMLTGCLNLGFTLLNTEFVYAKMK